MRSKGITEGVNPKEYKRQRDAGLLGTLPKKTKGKKEATGAITEFKKPTSRKGKE